MSGIKLTYKDKIVSKAIKGANGSLIISKPAGPNTGGVTSVNGQTGIVVLLIPTKTSQLTNDSGFLTSVPAQSFSSLTGKPTTLSGYGITDAYPLSGNPSGFLTSVPAQSFSSLTGKPTTLGGYGITDAYPLSGNPSGFLTSVPAQSFSSLTGKPTTLTGYGITDAYPLSGNPSGFLISVPAQSFSSLTGKPTTLSGYGITDAISSTRLISTTSPLTGGGDLSADRTIAFSFSVANTWTALQTHLFTGVGVGNSNAILLQNTTVATNSAQQNSPSLTLEGQGWKTTATAASQSVRFQQFVLPVQGSVAPTGSWKLQSSIAGGAFSDLISVTTAGGLVFSQASPTITWGSGPLSINFSSNSMQFTSQNIWGTADYYMDIVPAGASAFGGIESVSRKLALGTFGANDIVMFPNRLEIARFISGVGLSIGGGTATTSFFQIAAGTITKSQMNLALSTAPTSPVNGDIWFDGTNLFMRIGGTTKTFTII